MALRTAILALCLCVPAESSDAPAKSPAIRLPAAPVPPAPMPAPVPPSPAPAPAPQPPAVLMLAADQLYVIDSTPDATVIVHPPGAVKVTREAGPLRIRAKFAGGGGQLETRTFAGPHVFILEAAERRDGVGVFVVPKGYKDESEIVRATINVEGPQALIPPPKPKPVDPDPVDPVKPDPPTPGPKVRRLAVVVVEETGQRTPGQGKVLFDKAVRDWLKAGGHEIDVFEDDDAAAKVNGYLPHAAGVGLPAVLVFDADAKGPQKPLAVYRLPASGAAWKAELERAVKP